MAETVGNSNIARNLPYSQNLIIPIGFMILKAFLCQSLAGLMRLNLPISYSFLKIVTPKEVRYDRGYF